MSEESGEYCIEFVLTDGLNRRIMIGGSIDEINAKLDDLNLCYMDHEMWVVFENGNPVLINPDYIVWAGRSMT